MHMPWCRVGGINDGFLEHGSVELNTSTRKWRGTLLRGDVESEVKSSIVSAAGQNPEPLFAWYIKLQERGSSSASRHGYCEQIPPDSLTRAHLHWTMSPSGSLTAMSMVWLQPSWRRITGAMARGVELMRPVSFLFVKENLMYIFQYELNGLVQQQPKKFTITILLLL